MAYELLEFTLLGIFYGFCLSIAINSLFINIFKKDRTHGLFAMYVLASIFYIASVDKFGSYMTAYGILPYVDLVQAASVMLVHIFLLLYVRHLLRIDEYISDVLSLIWVFAALRIVLFFVELNHLVPIRISAFVDLGILIFISVISIRRIKEEHMSAKLFFGGMVIFFIGTVLFESRELLGYNVLDQSWMNSTLHLGFVIQLFTQNRAIAIQYKSLLVAQKEAEEVRKRQSILQSQWDMLMDILDYVPHQIFLKDADHKLVLANKRTVEVLKCKDRKEVLGKTDYDFFTPEVAKAYFKDEQEMLQSGKGRIIPEFEFHGKDGDERIFNSMKLPFFIKEYNTTGILGIEVEITEFKRIERELKDKNDEILSQKEENEFQKLKISELYNEVQDSIKTAKKIQEAIMPPEKTLAEYFHEYFVLYLPKDIVSGDFYWFKHIKGVDKLMFATVDCTGHGVAGAFISLIAHNLLNKIVDSKIYKTPAEILDRLNLEMMTALNQGPNSENGSHDGMDITLCMYDQKTNELEFAGACQQMVLVRNNEMELFKLDYFSIGYLNNKPRKFQNHSIELMEGDQIYLYSDGFAGQFGGENGDKKFLNNRLRETLLEHSHMPMENQKKSLKQKFDQWKGITEQTDDILVMGFKF